jgi:hypothetical protein
MAFQNLHDHVAEHGTFGVDLLPHAHCGLRMRDRAQQERQRNGADDAS